MKIRNMKLVRGYPQLGGFILVNGAYVAKVTNKDYDFISFDFITHCDLKEREVQVINPFTKEEIIQLEKDKPHLFV